MAVAEADDEADDAGEIYGVTGPVVTAIGLDAAMNDLVLVGDEGLMGEVIEIEDEKTTVQVYEETSGIKPGEPVENTGESLTVELGPGLLSTIYDGVQRPLPELADSMGDFIERGALIPGLDRERKWKFSPAVSRGDEVSEGDEVGVVQEKEIEHRIMVPPGVGGEVAEVVEEGRYTVEDVVATLDDGTELNMRHEWPVRRARPFDAKLRPDVPMVTGQRVLDTFFPIPKGGTGAIPGPFGSGKTVTQQQLAKWSDADIVVYIGCGERGNEMTEVLKEFPELEDPRTGEPLMNRTVLIANTSNMPVAAREASIYTGITIAEYYRDMGYDVALMADSTSRWAEAMREISSRLEEMPGEEGYPAYLAARLAEFYERAGRFETAGNAAERGSVTVVGAVSPPGGDFSEPVTQNTLRITKVFWALDASLSEKRHFPAINWLDSYSQYLDNLREWFSENVAEDFADRRAEAMSLLSEESDLQEIVQLVGSDALPQNQQLTLEISRMLRQYFLQQNAFHPVDTYCSIDKQYELLGLVLGWGEMAQEALERGVSVDDLRAMESNREMARITRIEDWKGRAEEVREKMEQEFEELEAEL